MLAPHTEFGKTKNVPVVVYQNNKEIESNTWDETLWVERAEDWYALMSSQLQHKRVRIVERGSWLRSQEVEKK